MSLHMVGVQLKSFIVILKYTRTPDKQGFDDNSKTIFLISQ